MRTRTRWGSLGAVLCGVVWAGCGSSEVEPVDLSQPLEGEQLDDADDLEGTWLAMNEGFFIGFEFMDDGQVLVTPATRRSGSTS